MSSDAEPLGDNSLDQRLDDLLRFMGFKHVDVMDKFLSQTGRPLADNVRRKESRSLYSF